MTIVGKHEMCSECEKMKILCFTLLPINIIKKQKLAYTCVKIALLITALSWGGSHIPYSQC